MKPLLELAVRTFCSLWESAADVTSSTPWSWDATKRALQESRRMGPGLIVEWEKLPEESRRNALRILAEFHPIRPDGDVVQFKDPSFVQRFAEAVIASDVLILNDSTLDVIGGPGEMSLRALAKDCGGTFRPSLLQEHYSWVDVNAPAAVLETGLDAVTVAGLLSKAVQTGLTEAELLKADTEENRFAGRLARFVKARKPMGGQKILSLVSEKGGRMSGISEGYITIEFAPKVITAEDVDPRDIMERKGSSRYSAALKTRVEEANALALMDAHEAARNMAVSLEKDHLSMLPVVEETRITIPVNDSTIAGVPAWLVEHAKSSGLMSVDTAAKLMLMEQRKTSGRRLLNEEGASVGPGGSAKSASDVDGERGGVSHEQPDVKAGRTAQSQADPQQEPQAPTEHVPDSEEGAPGGDVKLADGTVVPEPVMKDAMAKLLQNLATQLQQDTETDGQPQDPADAAAEEEPEDPEAAQKKAEDEAAAEQDAASQATQNGVPQPDAAAAQTAVSGKEGTGKMSEDVDDLARKILNGEMTVAEALGSQPQEDFQDALDWLKDEMEESAWVDDLQKIIPHVEAGLKAAGYKKDDDGYWCEKDGDDKIKLAPTPSGLLILHNDPDGLSMMTEELDLGSGEEGQQMLVAVADAADTMKAMRAAMFALSTDHLVRISSMAKAIGAAPASSEADSLQKDVEKMLGDTEKMAQRMEKIHSKVQGKAGGDASTLQAPDELPPEPAVEEPPPEEPPVAPEQQVPVEEPPPTAPVEEPAPVAESEFSKANEKVIREAVARCAGTEVPQMIWDGAPYGAVRRAVISECRDLSLDSTQIAEVRNRIRRMETVNQGRVYALQLTEGDQALLLGVSLKKGDAPSRAVEAAGAGKGVTERTLSEAVQSLRQYGELEHKLLAESLDKQMVTALAGAR